MQKKLTILIPLAMISGLVYGQIFDPTALKTGIIPLVVIMVFPMMMGLNFRSLLSGVDIKLQLVTQAFNFLVIPFLAYGLTLVFLPEEPVFDLAFLLLALLPTAGMTIAWTGFAGGNVESVVKMVILGLVLGSLLAPVYINWLAGEAVDVPFGLIIQKIFYIVFVPMFLAVSTRTALIRRYGFEYFRDRIKPKITPLSSLGPVGIVFVSLALRSDFIVEDPLLIGTLLVPLVIFYAANYLLGTLLAKAFFNREDGLALVFGSVMRNLSVSLAIAFTVFGSQGPDIALVLAVAFILQPQSAAWYIRFSHKWFRSAKSMP